ATESGEVWRTLEQLGGPHARYLKDKCPKKNFKTIEAWVKAMQNEIQKTMMPAAVRHGNPPDEVLIKHSSAVLTDDAFSRELEFEMRIDRELEQALERLRKIKAAKQRTSFREAQRFDRSHSEAII